MNQKNLNIEYDIGLIITNTLGLFIIVLYIYILYIYSAVYIQQACTGTLYTCIDIRLRAPGIYLDYLS